MSTCGCELEALLMRKYNDLAMNNWRIASRHVDTIEEIEEPCKRAVTSMATLILFIFFSVWDMRIVEVVCNLSFPLPMSIRGIERNAHQSTCNLVVVEKPGLYVSQEPSAYYELCQLREEHCS